ncbi:MAG: hypothetical protein KDC83_15500 [Flavobacteriales bacterium]|nr:hypothetical protein [Flavobacteriales bacterium]
MEHKLKELRAQKTILESQLETANRIYDTQVRLAEAGKENTLVFQQKKVAEAELALRLKQDEIDDRMEAFAKAGQQPNIQNINNITGSSVGDVHQAGGEITLKKEIGEKEGMVPKIIKGVIVTAVVAVFGYVMKVFFSMP